MDKKGSKFQEWIDDDLTMPYVKLEKRFGIKRPRVTRAIDELLAKGFIEIRHAGGAYKKDKSVYALIDKYLLWSPGTVFNRRDRDVKRGYQGSKENVIELKPRKNAKPKLKPRKKSKPNPKLKLRKNSTHVNVTIHGHVNVL